MEKKKTLFLGGKGQQGGKGNYLAGKYKRREKKVHQGGAKNHVFQNIKKEEGGEKKKEPIGGSCYKGT